MLFAIISALSAFYSSHLWHSNQLNQKKAVHEDFVQSSVDSAHEDHNDYMLLYDKHLRCTTALHSHKHRMYEFADDFNLIAQQQYPNFPIQVLVQRNDEDPPSNPIHTFSIWAVPDGLQVHLIAI